MAEIVVNFVEWKEEFVSQERGSRIVHYVLKDSCGKSVLAVVGTERSLRHMVYVVAEEFLSYSGTDNPVQAGFKWRSRREVVDWLTSMLARQQQADSPSGDSTHSLGSSELLSARYFTADKMQSYSDIVWLGAAWTCGKQLKHYPSFCRNGITIAVQAFVFVMAKEGSRYVAYLEDMYEDKKGMKKVKVRWFHHSQEVKGIVRIRNAHPKEVYITPYTQVISVECVDGPAIVLTREHFEKCLEGLPEGLLGKLHLCCRQFRSNKVKPFDLRKLRGYNNQPVISCLESESFLNSNSVQRGVIGNRAKMFGSGGNVAKGTKRTRNYGDRESFLTSHGAEGLERKKFVRVPFSKNGNSDACAKRLLSFKNGEFQRSQIQFFKVDDKIELLCQDSGIRGCWFICTVLEISRKHMKLQYRDLEDQDGYGNLEECVPAFRLAAPDKLGMRCPGRPTIRPCPPISDSVDVEFEVGAPVDAWWSDGWWEGVVTAVKKTATDDVQVYVPGENKFIDVPRKDLRVSRDWLGGKWVDVKANPNILLDIKAETKQSIVTSLSTLGKDGDDDSALKIKDGGNEDKLAELAGPASSAGHPEQVSSSDKDDVNDKSNDVSIQDMCCNGDDQNVGVNNNDGGKEGELGTDEALELQDMCCDVDDKNENKEGESGTNDLETKDDEALELTEVMSFQDICCDGDDKNDSKDKNDDVETADEATELTDVPQTCYCTKLV
nr:uncharacterized protein LOC110782720 isoform X2 [Spinacia oleracea]